MPSSKKADDVPVGNSRIGRERRLGLLPGLEQRIYARALNGHAAVAPPSSVMKRRRFHSRNAWKIAGQDPPAGEDQAYGFGSVDHQLLKIALDLSDGVETASQACISYSVDRMLGRAERLSPNAA